MLAVNNVPINLNDPTSPYTQEVLAGFKKIRDTYGDKFNLVFRDKFGVRINPTGNKEPGKRAALSYKATIFTKNGSETWRYSDAYPIDGKYKKSRFIFSDSFTVNYKQIDLAFFILYKSNFLSSGYMKLVNKKEEAKKQVSAKQRMISTRWYLYDEASPIYNNEETIRMIALAFGVSRADNRDDFSLDQIKLALESVIEKAEVEGNREKNENAFKNALDMDGAIKMKSLVQKAIDNEIIGFEAPSWFMIGEKGKLGEKMCTVPSTEFDRADEVLIEYLKRNVYHREAVETALGKVGGFDEPSDITNEMIDTMKFVQKLAWAKKYGFKKFGAKDEEVTAFLRTKAQ
jgi:hypothetical protein